MHARLCLFLSLLGLPVLAPAQEIVSGNAPAKAAGASEFPRRGRKKLDLKDMDVQHVLRAAAARQSAEQPATANPPSEGADDMTRMQQNLLAPVVRSTRRPQSDQCVGADCIAYEAGDAPWFRLQRNLTGLVFTSDRDFDQWLSCQQNDDMLSTFERYERCDLTYIPERQVVKAEPRLPKKSPQAETSSSR